MADLLQSLPTDQNPLNHYETQFINSLFKKENQYDIKNIISAVYHMFINFNYRGFNMSIEFTDYVIEEQEKKINLRVEAYLEKNPNTTPEQAEEYIRDKIERENYVR